MHQIVAAPRHARAIRAVAGLLTRLRLDFVFVGSVARSADAWEFAATVRQIAGVTSVVQSIETQSR